MHAERLRELTEIYRAAARKVDAEADREGWDERQVERMHDIAMYQAQQAAMATGATREECREAHKAYLLAFFEETKRLGEMLNRGEAEVLEPSRNRFLVSVRGGKSDRED
jgi:hypothetical protein